MKNKNFHLIAYYLGIFIAMIGFIELIPLIMLIFYPEEIQYAKCFLLPGVTCIILGYLINRIFKNTTINRLDKHYNSILVVSVWVIAIFVSAFPWMLEGEYNFSQAIFETTSGFTTTGLTVVDVEKCSHIFLFFRSVALFVGGIGLVLILTCALSDAYGLSLYNAEGHNDRLLPNLKKSARFIFTIYFIYIALGTLAYYLAGMSLFDALNTAIAALSTGGFSTRNASIYAYHSLSIEIITIVLMLLGMTNFTIHLSLLRGKFKVAIKNAETKFFVLVFSISLVLMISNLLKVGFTSNIFEAIRVSIFQLISAITTTGFVSVSNLSILPSFFVSIMILLMLIGGNMESTSGGIKQYRVIVALKGIYYSIKDTILNSRVVKCNTIYRFGKKNILGNEEIASCTTYVLFYIILFLIGSTIFTFYGYNLQDSMFEFSSALSTVGLSVGITGYNANNVILWTGSIGMFFGRLEIMVIFEALTMFIKNIRNA